MSQMNSDLEKLNSLYERAKKIPNRISGITAYGCNTDLSLDCDVIMDFFEIIVDIYEDKEITEWAQAYIQLYSWQFQRYHEGVSTYYDNLYEFTGHDEIMKAATYLCKIGFKCISDMMINGFDDACISEIEEWIDEHEEDIYEAYIKLIRISKK